MGGLVMRRAVWVDKPAVRKHAWVWLAIGVPALLFGFLLLAAAVQFQGRSATTAGKVVRHQAAMTDRRDRRDAAGNSVRSVVPVVRYYLPDGRGMELHGMRARDPNRAPRIGRQVAVRYSVLADGTVSARIDSLAEIWGVPALFTLFGGAFTLFGAAGLRVSRRPA